jgi:hypothetical protein
MTDHPAHDADDAMRPLVAGCLAAIVIVTLLAVLAWAVTPPGRVVELAPTTGTTVTEGP